MLFAWSVILKKKNRSIGQLDFLLSNLEIKSQKCAKFAFGRSDDLKIWPLTFWGPENTFFNSISASLAWIYIKVDLLDAKSLILSNEPSTASMRGRRAEISQVNHQSTRWRKLARGQLPVEETVPWDLKWPETNYIFFLALLGLHKWRHNLIRWKFIQICVGDFFYPEMTERVVYTLTRDYIHSYTV